MGVTELVNALSMELVRDGLWLPPKSRPADQEMTLSTTPCMGFPPCMMSLAGSVPRRCSTTVPDWPRSHRHLITVSIDHRADAAVSASATGRPCVEVDDVNRVLLCSVGFPRFLRLCVRSSG